MKKILFLTACLVAIVGFRVIPVHAQSMTPAQTAALEQSLADAKASLVKLQMEEGIVPPAEPGTPSVTPTAEVTFPATVTPVTVSPVQTSSLSPQDVVALNSALTALEGTLVNMSSKLATDPSLAANDAVVLNSLQGIGNTLALIGQSASGRSTITPSAPVAVNTPAPAAANPKPVVSVTPSAPVAVNMPAPLVPTPSVTPAPTVTPTTQTAQASSFWSFTEAHWPTITIVLLIILILAILLWPGSEETTHVAPVKIQNNQPSAPRVAVSSPVAPMTPTPMSNVVSTSAPGSVEFQQTKVTVVRPPEQKKKTA